MNINQNEQNYKYPQKIRLANDLTANNGPIPPADTRLLDQDVVNLMIACYPHVALHELLLEYEDIMCQFWSDSKHGLETTLSIGGINDNESEISPPDSDDDSSMTSTLVDEQRNQCDEESSTVFLDHDTNDDDDSFIASDEDDDDDEDEDDDSSAGDDHESFICSVEHDSAAEEEDDDN